MELARMQHRYVGDFGDYVKLAILRALSPGRYLGIAWWLFPDESHNGDGRHLCYLDQPQKWREFDPSLFDSLYAIRKKGKRDIAYLEQLLPGGTLFASEAIPSDTQPYSCRPEKRQQWFQHVMEQLGGANLVFLDPDNGIEPCGFKSTQKKSGKSVSFTEIDCLARAGRDKFTWEVGDVEWEWVPDPMAKPIIAPEHVEEARRQLRERQQGRTDGSSEGSRPRRLVIYHHQTRRKDGHLAELDYLAKRLKEKTKLQVSGALRASPWSPRAFFMLDADAPLIERAEQIARTWQPHITWHPFNML
jgi:hypothetical protein